MCHSLKEIDVQLITKLECNPGMRVQRSREILQALGISGISEKKTAFETI